MDIMVLQPKPEDYPRIRKALRIYKVASIVTGIMLLLLLTEMILKYAPVHVELFAGGSEGGLYFAPVIVGEGCQWFSLFNPWQVGCEMTTTGDGVNLSLLILITHGWFYVGYLISAYLLWSPMRWNFWRFLQLALGGVVPLMSFFLEVKIAREVSHFLDERERSVDDASAAAAASTTTAASAAQTSKGQ